MVKEGGKQIKIWSNYYFTNKKSYYPIPPNSSRFWNIPLLSPLPAVSMSDVHQDFMREWARNNGKTMRQRTVRQETTKYKSGTLPLNMYKTEEEIGEKLQFDRASEEREEASIVMKVALTLTVIWVMMNLQEKTFWGCNIPINKKYVSPDWGRSQNEWK